MPPALPILSAAALLLAPLAPPAEHNRLDWMLGKGASIEIRAGSRTARGFASGWTGAACESRFTVVTLADMGKFNGPNPARAVIIDWSRMETPAATEAESSDVRLVGPFKVGTGVIDSLTLELSSPPLARSAVEAMNRLRLACRPQR